MKFAVVRGCFRHIYITLYMTSVFLCCSGTCVKTIYKPPSPGLVFFIIQTQGPLVHRIFFYFLPKVISNVSEANGEKNKECGGVWLFVSNGIFLPLILTEQSSRESFSSFYQQHVFSVKVVSVKNLRVKPEQSPGIERHDQRNPTYTERKQINLGP